MQNSKPLVETPTLKRRFICLVYDALLLTAVVMLALFVFLFATQKLQGGHVQEYGRAGSAVPCPGRLLDSFAGPAAATRWR